MLVAIVFSIFVLVFLALLAGGLALTAKQITFLKQAYPVQGTVISEWQYRHRGQLQRYYRVEFRLRNGQRAELRGSGSRPPVGSPQVVLVREAPGQDPKAQIDAWSELWFMPSVMLGMGLFGLLMLAMTLHANPV